MNKKHECLEMLDKTFSDSVPILQIHYDSVNKIWVLAVWRKDSEVEGDHIPIEYCPFCGVALKGEIQ